MTKLNFKMSAAVLLNYLMAKTGFNESRLKKDFLKQYQLTDPKSITANDRGYIVTTKDYEIRTTRYGKITAVRHATRRAGVVEKRQRKVAKAKKPRHPVPQTAKAEPQPETHTSAIIDTIQREAQPRVFIKRRKTMEPH